MPNCLSNHDKPILYLVLFGIILLEGFTTISLEILTIRQLMPITGNTVIVTSLIIGTFLLFLAYGYRKGGRYQSNYTAILKNNFTIVAIGLGFGLSYYFIEYFFNLFYRYISTNLLVSLSVYLLLVTAPLIYLLGQTVPITFNFFKRENDRVSQLSGHILHISTLGSFLGAVLTSLLLLNYFGAAWTVFINFMVLVLLVALLANEKRDIIRFVILLGFGIAIYAVNVQVQKNTFVLTNAYANYHVNSDIELPTKARGKLLNVNSSNSSFLNEQLQAFPYIELIKKILFQDLNLQNKEILVLGAGGFTLSAEYENQNHFTYIDVDPQIKQVVQKYFLQKIHGKFIADDARHYLNTLQKHYDVIVADAYSNGLSLPAHLLTREYFNSIYRALAVNGLAVINVIAKPTLQDAYSKHMDNTIRSVFGSCMLIPKQYTEQVTNIIYVCKKNNNENDKEIYSDNLNRSALEFFKLN